MLRALGKTLGKNEGGPILAQQTPVTPRIVFPRADRRQVARALRASNVGGLARVDRNTGGPAGIFHLHGGSRSPEKITDSGGCRGSRRSHRVNLGRARGFLREDG
jgi:hypothetical protein